MEKLRSVDVFTREDIDLVNKLDNMLDSEITDDIYDFCMENLEKITSFIWNTLCDENSIYYYAEAFEGLADEFETDDEHEKWSACLYNCDALYMWAITKVLTR